MRRIVLIPLFFLCACFEPPEKPDSLQEKWNPEEPVLEEGLSGEEEEKEAEEGTSQADPVGATTTEPGGTSSFTAEAPVVEPFGKVVINEIYYDVSGSDTDGVLFVELYGEAGLSLAGCQVLFVNGGDGKITDSITLPEEALIPEDGFYLIADSRDGSAAETQVLNLDLIDNFDPQNGPDAVQLLSAEGEVVDVVGYGTEMVATAENNVPLFEESPAPDVTGGHSLARLEPGLDTDNNADDFVELATPTPGF